VQPFETAPDNRKAALKRGFEVTDCCAKRVVRTVKHNRNLIEAEQGICVKNEHEKDLSAGEVLLAEGCAVDVGGFERAASTPDTIGVLPSSDRPTSAPRARCVLPELLESPFDEGVERLGPNSKIPSSIKF
jgi:hypothetical protein